MKKFTITRLSVYLLGMILIGSLVGCMKDDDPTHYPQAVLTMVNGYISTPGVVYTADNNAIHTPNNPLTYKSYNFNYLFPGSRRIRVFTPSSVLLADETYTFKDSTYYTSFVFGKSTDAVHRIYEDRLLTDLSGDKMAIRFFNLAASGETVHIYLDNMDNALAQNVPYLGTLSEENVSRGASFVSKESGTQKIIVTNQAGDTLIEREFAFAKNVHYSIILIGDSTSETTPLYIGVVRQYE